MFTPSFAYSLCHCHNFTIPNEDNVEFHAILLTCFQNYYSRLVSLTLTQNSIFVEIACSRLHSLYLYMLSQQFLSHSLGQKEFSTSLKLLCQKNYHTCRESKHHTRSDSLTIAYLRKTCVTSSLSFGWFSILFTRNRSNVFNSNKPARRPEIQKKISSCCRK